MGSLRVDGEEPLEIRTAVANFQQDLVDKLQLLTHKSSPLKLGEVEFPDILPTEKGQEQVARFVASLKAAAAKAQTDPHDSYLLNDFAEKLERTTETHLDRNARTVDSPELRERVSKTADKVILNTAVDRFLRREPAQTNTTDPKSEVWTLTDKHNRTHSINLEDNGVIYNSGDVAEALRESRGRMLNKDNIMNGLSKSQWKALREKLPGQADTKIAEHLSAAITVMRNEVSSGGAVGSGRPVFIDEIVQRLKARSSDDLLGRPIAKPAKPEKPPEIPQQYKTMASEFAATWTEAGFSKPMPGENIDPTAVELVFEELASGKPDPGPYQDMLQKYLAGDPGTTKLIETPLRQ
jgi:hypothetical protein